MSDNPAKVPFHLGGPGIMTHDKQFSIHLSKTLNFLGKSQDMVKNRVKMYKKIERVYTHIMSSLNHIIAGSKMEGLTAPYESDHDFMIVYPDVICADNSRSYTNNRRTTVFQTERHDTPAGYSKLKLVHESYNQISGPQINDSLFENANGERYISSDFLITRMMTYAINRDEYQSHARSGPSMPSSDHAGNINADHVIAFYCKCPDLLKAFIGRPRPYNRPSRSILNDISFMDAHVVPVGCKESDTSYQEWRICFTLAEGHLIQNFNDIETKLYILLKNVSKLFKHISNDITSYVMKNICLWMVELSPADMFTDELLTERLVQALIFLKNCVQANYLHSYMIPDRNLLAGGLEPIQRHRLTSFLSTLIREEGSLLLRCEKLQVAMAILYREPAMAEEFRWRRDMLEKIFLLDMNISFGKMVTICFTSIEQAKQWMASVKMNDAADEAFTALTIPEVFVMLLQGYSDEAIAALGKERQLLMLA